MYLIHFKFQKQINSSSSVYLAFPRSKAVTKAKWKEKLKATEKLLGNDSKIQDSETVNQCKLYPFKTIFYCQMALLQKPIRFLVLYSAKQFEAIRCKSVAKIFMICQCIEAVAHIKDFPIPLSFATYRYSVYCFCVYRWLNCCFRNSIIICTGFPNFYFSYASTTCF